MSDTHNTGNANSTDNNTHDPLWKALVQGDTSCPDGESLVALGQLLRTEAQCTASADFAARVLAASASTSENDLIDAMYNDDQQGSVAAADPGLAKLRRVTQAGSELPQAVNMLPEVLDGLRRRRHTHEDSEDNGVTRWRVWSSVIFAHVAALITVTVLWAQYNLDTSHLETEGDTAPIMYTNRQAAQRENVGDQYMDLHQLDQHVEAALAGELPQRWSQLRGRADALFIIRQNDELKNMYRSFYGSNGSQATVNAALSWLQTQQQKNGAFTTAQARSSSRALATHALATLALLGDGVHDTNRQSIIAACQFLRKWVDERGAFLIGEEDASSEAAQGMAILATVEASILLADTQLQDLCEKMIAAHAPQQLQRHAGLDGYFLLALETAQTAGIAVSRKDLISIRQRIRSGAKNSQDLGKSGTYTFARYINGFRDAQVQTSLHIFAEHLPDADSNQRIDPLAWFFPSLALREAGSIDWRNWNSSLQRATLSCFTYDNVKNLAWIPGARVRHANSNDVFATSMALLNLQTAYRYVPLL